MAISIDELNIWTIKILGSIPGRGTNPLDAVSKGRLP